jgi:vancomycin resistance protein VanW
VSSEKLVAQDQVLPGERDMRDAPREVRRLACQVRRMVTDWFCGYRRKLVRAGQGDAGQAAAFLARVSLEQPILPTDYVEAKIHNITLALKRVNNLPVAPGAIFSFWQVVGRPGSARGFVPGRSLLAGQLRPDYGGGLCHLSGLMYCVSLMAGLEVLERHPHSRDIYNDQTRYAPLGADATVAYGFKDLRVLNPYSFPVCFRAAVSPARVSCCLCCPHPVEESHIEFARTAQANGVTTVETRRRRTDEPGYRVLNVSSYRALDEHDLAHMSATPHSLVEGRDQTQ